MEQEEKNVQQEATPEEKNVQQEEVIKLFIDPPSDESPIPTRFILGKSQGTSGIPILVRDSATSYKMIALEYQGDIPQNVEANGFTDVQVIWSLLERFNKLSTIYPSVDVNTVIKDLKDAIEGINRITTDLQQKQAEKDAATIKQSDTPLTTNVEVEPNTDPA